MSSWKKGVKSFPVLASQTVTVEMLSVPFRSLSMFFSRFVLLVCCHRVSLCIF